jgi:hypothetical protein
MSKATGLIAGSAKLSREPRLYVTPFHETQALRALCQRKLTVPRAFPMRKGAIYKNYGFLFPRLFSGNRFWTFSRNNEMSVFKYACNVLDFRHFRDNKNFWRQVTEK